MPGTQSEGDRNPRLRGIIIIFDGAIGDDSSLNRDAGAAASDSAATLKGSMERR